MCLFCDIIDGTEESEILYEDDLCIVIKDKFPTAKFHVLVIPKQHIDSISTLEEEDLPIISYLVFIAKNIAEEECLPGYKLQWNVNKEGGQVIFHIHLHLMSNAQSE